MAVDTGRTGENTVLTCPHGGSILDSFVEAERLLRGKHKNGETLKS